jgi:hypothetical protein
MSSKYQVSSSKYQVSRLRFMITIVLKFRADVQGNRVRRFLASIFKFADL